MSKLTVTTPSEREIVVTRVFDAPRRLVFEALTQPALLKQWLHGMPGWTMPVCEMDLRPGGAYRWVWENQEGGRMGMGGVLQEITPPERLVSTERWDDPWFPGEALVTQTLVEAGGRTTLTITIRYESREARDGVAGTGATDGMGASYDRLEELLVTGAVAMS